jgi:hypothetical protein
MELGTVDGALADLTSCLSPKDTRRQPCRCYRVSEGSAAGVLAAQHLLSLSAAEASSAVKLP